MNSINTKLRQLRKIFNEDIVVQLLIKSNKMDIMNAQKKKYVVNIPFEYAPEEDPSLDEGRLSVKGHNQNKYFG